MKNKEPLQAGELFTSDCIDYPQGGTTITHDNRPYTKPKLTPPVFKNAADRPVKFGFLGEILGKLSKESK